MRVRIRIKRLTAAETLELTNIFSISIAADDTASADAVTDYIIANERTPAEEVRMRTPFNFSSNLLEYIKITANTPTKVVYVEGMYNIF